MNQSLPATALSMIIMLAILFGPIGALIALDAWVHRAR